MHTKKEELYNKIKDIKTKEEFEKEINSLKEEYDGLLDDETLALLIVDSLGKNKENICKIKDIKDGIECTVFGKVTKINNSHSFNRKNGTNGIVVNLELSDETGSCGLVLWNKDVDMVKNKTIKLNTNLKIINGYVKDGYNGIELNLGRYGLIEIIDKEIDAKKQATDDKIKGEIVDVQPSKAFFKDNGEFGFVTKLKLETKKGLKEITIWDEKVKEIQEFKEGDKIEISHIDNREKNGIEELHLNGKGKIQKI